MAPLFDYDSHRKGPSTPVRRSIRIAKQLQSGEELDLLSKLESEDSESFPQNHHIIRPKESIAKSSLRWSFSSYSVPEDDSVPGTPTKAMGFPFSTQAQQPKEHPIRALDFENTNVIPKDKSLPNHAVNHGHESNNIFAHPSASFSDSSSFSEKSSSSDSMIFLKTSRVPFHLRLRRLFSNVASHLVWPYNVSLKYRPILFFLIAVILLLLTIKHLYRSQGGMPYNLPFDFNGPSPLSDDENPGMSPLFPSTSHTELILRIQELDKIVAAIIKQQHQLSEKFDSIFESHKIPYAQLDEMQSVQSTFREKLESMSSKFASFDRNIVRHSELEMKLSNVISQFNLALSDASKAASSMFSELKGQLATQDTSHTNDVPFHHQQSAQPDYALYSLGARPLLAHSSDTLHVLNSFISRYFGIGVIGKAHMYALLPGVIPGNCWCFNGNNGSFSFAIPRAIAPTSFSIDHPSATALSNRSSAPRRIELWASSDMDLESTNNFAFRLLRKFSSASSISDPWNVFLGSFEYNIDGPSMQTFTLSRTHGLYKAFQLRILNNWGKMEYTCLYKISLHSSD